MLFLVKCGIYDYLDIRTFEKFSSAAENERPIVEISDFDHEVKLGLENRGVLIGCYESVVTVVNQAVKLVVFFTNFFFLILFQVGFALVSSKRVFFCPPVWIFKVSCVGMMGALVGQEAIHIASLLGAVAELT